MFSEQFRERLRYGKYSKWAVDLTEDQLQAIIWMLGEYGYRACYVLPLLSELWDAEPSGRAVLALEQLYRVVDGGERPNLEARSEELGKFTKQLFGFRHAKDTGRPSECSWTVRWHGPIVGWITSPSLDGGTCSGVWWPAAAGSLEFMSAVIQPSTDGARVLLRGIPAVVKSPPDNSGLMEFSLGFSTRELLAMIAADASATHRAS
jgi:hypothetical protein